MHICLVSPPPAGNTFYEQWDLSAVDAITPPLGTLLIAAILRRAGHRISLVDAYSNGLSVQDTAKRVLEINPDALGITATTPVVLGAGAIASLVKEKAPEMWTILGGAHVTAIPKETMEMLPGFDMAVIGEGDLTAPELFDALEHKGAEGLGSVQGIVYRHQGDIRFTPPRPILMNLDSLPYPAWDMLPSLSDPYHVSITSMNSGKSTAILTSRGCPGQCTFCDTRVFGRKLRAHSAEYVLNMIDHLFETYHITDLAIYDDNFTTFRERLVEICRGLRKRGNRVSWSCNARVNMVTHDMLKMMHDAGCWQVEYGIESGNQEILKQMNKSINLDQVRKALTWTKEVGMYTKGNFIFGFPGETRETLNDTLKFIQTIDLDFFQQLFFTPFPGSEASSKAHEHGITNFDWSTLNNQTINFIPHGLSEHDLINTSKKAFRKFYLRPQVILTHVKRINSIYAAKRYVQAGLVFLKTIFRKSN